MGAQQTMHVFALLGGKAALVCALEHLRDAGFEPFEFRVEPRTVNSNRHAAPIDNAFNNSAFEWIIELPSANDRRTANALRCCSTAKAWHAAYRVSPPVHGIDWSMFCGEALAIRYMGRSGGMPSAKKKGTSAGLLNKRLKYFGSIRM